MGEFKIIETQEQLDTIITERVARAKESARKEFEGWLSPEQEAAKLKELQEQNSKQKKEAEETAAKLTELNSQLAERDKKIAKYETDSAKTRIANEVGLSYEAIEYLRGETEEEIKKSAERLKSIVGNGKVPPLADPEGDTSKETTKAAYKKMLQKMKGE